MSHREDLFYAVNQYLKSQNWKYSSDVTRFSFDYSMGMGIGEKLNSCRMIIVAEETGIVFLAVCPINATEDNRAAVAEYLTRANYGLKSGNFEMDYKDGEVRYKNYICCIESVPSQKEIEFTNDVCFLMFKKYGDGLIKNIMGFGDPETDYEAAEAMK